MQHAEFSFRQADEIFRAFFGGMSPFADMGMGMGLDVGPGRQGGLGPHASMLDGFGGLNSGFSASAAALWCVKRAKSMAELPEGTVTRASP